MIKEPSAYGYELIKELEFDFPFSEFVLQHHEIYIESKIIGVADIFEAISSHRPYRTALGTDVATNEIKKNSGIIYDEEVIKVTLKVLDHGFKFSNIPEA